MVSSRITILSFGAVTAMALVAAPLASAAPFPAPSTTTATATVVEGTRTVSFSGPPATGVQPVSSSHMSALLAIPLTLSVNDSSGTRDAWSVTVSSTDFVYSGGHGGSNIPAGNFTISPASFWAPPEASVLLGDGGTLDQDAVTVLTSTQSANGVFDVDLEGSLVIPVDSYVGTYTATLTTTFGVAPIPG